MYGNIYISLYNAVLVPSDFSAFTWLTFVFHTRKHALEMLPLNHLCPELVKIPSTQFMFYNRGTEDSFVSRLGISLRGIAVACRLL